MMNSSDAMVILIDAFPLDGVFTDVQGNLVNVFVGDFSFAASETDADTIRLSAHLSGLPQGNSQIARRLLEANLAGVETGAGAMAPDPVGSGVYALVDTVDVSSLDADGFRLRVVDFMLFVEYWRSEGVAEVLDAIRRDASAHSEDMEAVMVRA